MVTYVRLEVQEKYFPLVPENVSCFKELLESQDRLKKNLLELEQSELQPSGARVCCKKTNAALDCAAGWRYYTWASGDIYH